MKATENALEDLHQTAIALFREALSDCNIDAAFDRRIRFEGNKLLRLMPEGDGPAELDLKAFSKINIIAIGKAAVPMLETLLQRMPRRQGVSGICCSPEIPERRHWRFRYFQGGHPLPNEDSLAAARAALSLMRKARKDTLAIFLISGGASALFDLPLEPDITLEDTIAFHDALIGSGAPITEINIVRKHFSAVKGGRLALAAADATKLSILLPDVPIRSLDALASGPTSPDRSTVEEVRAVLERYHLLEKFPPAVRAFFEHENLPESPGNKSRRAPFLPRLPWADGHTIGLRRATATHWPSEEQAFRGSMFEVLLSSHDLVESARIRAQRAGYYTVIDNSCDDWDYADSARYLLQRFHAIRAEHPRCCLISGGEVTVTINRTPGAGGRNQQFTLACALELAQLPPDAIGSLLVVLSAGSDGIDGNTRAAGAIADPTTVRRALQFGYQPAQALAEFNACPLFTALGDTVVTGPTGQNLRDLRLLISEAV
jgi:hydroxypyruvate reductase